MFFYIFRIFAHYYVIKILYLRLSPTETIDMKTIKIIFLLLFICVEVCAQRPGEHENGNFVYENEGDTVLVRLSTTGISNIITNKSISIPSNVKRVVQGAFSNFSVNGAMLNTLIVEGNPYFEKADERGLSSLDESTADGIQSSITTIQMGSNMSENNMLALLSCLYRNNSLNRVEINGVAGSDSIKIKWLGNEENTQIDSILTTNVNVVLPANLVTNQVFGDAKVYGLFETAYDYSTTCVGATYIDKNDGSNMLFYVPTETQTVEGVKKARFNRVHYIIANEGLLIHHAPNTATRAELERIDCLASYKEDLTDADKVVYKRDSANYKKNMLVGSVNPQTIEAKVGGYTNMILYNGSFIPTSGGTLGANKAYLKVPTSYLNGVSGAKLMMSLDNETGGETTGIHSVENVKLTIDNEDGVWYTLDGRKLIGKPTLKGVYIHDGTKVAIR